MKTAVATSPSMCEAEFCEKSAEKLLIRQVLISSPDVTEEVLCYPHFDKVISGYTNDLWIAENL
jgi:hypothetical protein